MADPERVRFDQGGGALLIWAVFILFCAKRSRYISWFGRGEFRWRWWDIQLGSRIHPLRARAIYRTGETSQLLILNDGHQRHCFGLFPMLTFFPPIDVRLPHMPFPPFPLDPLPPLLSSDLFWLRSRWERFLFACVVSSMAISLPQNSS